MTMLNWARREVEITYEEWLDRGGYDGYKD